MPQMSKQVCYIRDCESQGCSGGKASDPKTTACQHRGGGSGNRLIASHSIDLKNSSFLKQAKQWVSSEWGTGGMADGSVEGVDDQACKVEECNWIASWTKKQKSTYCEHKNYTEDEANCCLGYTQPEEDINFPMLGENYLTSGDMTIAGLSHENDPHLAFWQKGTKVNVLFKRTNISHMYTLQYMDMFAYPHETGKKQSNMLDAKLNDFYLTLDCNSKKVYWSPERNEGYINWKVTKQQGKYKIQSVSETGRAVCSSSILKVGTPTRYDSMVDATCNLEQLDGTYYIVAGSKKRSPGEIADRNCGNSGDPESLSGIWGQANTNADVYKFKRGQNDYRGGIAFRIKPKGVRYTIEMGNTNLFLAPESTSSNNVRWAQSEHEWYIEAHPKSASDNAYANWYSIKSSRNNPRVYLSTPNSDDCEDERNVDLYSEKRWWKILPELSKQVSASVCKKSCDETPQCTAYETTAQSADVCSLFSNTDESMRSWSRDAKQQKGRTCHTKKEGFQVSVGSQTVLFQIEKVPAADQLQWVQWRHQPSDHSLGSWKDPHAFFQNEHKASTVGDDDKKMSLFLRNLKDPSGYRKFYPENEHRHYNSLIGYNPDAAFYNPQTDSTMYDPCHEKFVTHKTCHPAFERGSRACRTDVYPQKCKQLEYAAERGIDVAWKKENAPHGGCQTWFDNALKDRSSAEFDSAASAANVVCVANANHPNPDSYLANNCEKWAQQQPGVFVPYISDRCTETVNSVQKTKKGRLQWNKSEGKAADDAVCGSVVQQAVGLYNFSDLNSQQNGLALDLIDKMVTSYCNDIQNKDDPRCACFFNPNSADHEWQKEEGRKNYRGLTDVESRLDPVCVVPKCGARQDSFRTQRTYKTMKEGCPACIQGIKNEVWDSEWKNISQNNTCNFYADGSVTKTPASHVIVNGPVPEVNSSKGDCSALLGDRYESKDICCSCVSTCMAAGSTFEACLADCEAWGHCKRSSPKKSWLYDFRMALPLDMQGLLVDVADELIIAIPLFVVALIGFGLFLISKYRRRRLYSMQY